MKRLFAVLLVEALLAAGCVQPQPAVYELFPEPGDTQASAETTISVTFSKIPQVVDLTTVPEVEIVHVSQHVVGAEATPVIFYPANPLQWNTTYDVTITYGQEKRPVSTVNWQFTTGEPMPPNPKVNFPQNGAKDVPVDTLISVSFWRGTASVAQTTELIMKPEVEIGQIMTEEYGVASVKLDFRPARPLFPQTTYIAILSYNSGRACLVREFTTLRPGVAPAISREQAIEIAARTIRESIVARADIRAELHAWYWEVMFDNMNAVYSELTPIPLKPPPSLPGQPQTIPESYQGIFQSVVITVDAETGYLLSAGASKAPRPGPYVSQERAIASAREHLAGIPFPGPVWFDSAKVEAYLRGDIWHVLFYDPTSSECRRVRVSVDAVTGIAQGASSECVAGKQTP